MLRATIILIEFCALLGEGSVPVAGMPDPHGNVTPATSFHQYLDCARWYEKAFPSTLPENQQNVPEMLPCPN